MVIGSFLAGCATAAWVMWSRHMHKKGVKRPLVVAPGFTTDCLETLDELGNEGRDEFAHGGGDPEAYSLCPCLNDHPGWIDAMADLVAAATKP